ncbi:MAG TPA: PilZ domain-containing protein [Thermodesulfovibrionales bacterium]|nr:PilZ domain-containing protein [Thermodesulfovibrionales bacterium]
MTKKDKRADGVESRPKPVQSRKWYRYQFFGSAKVKLPKEKKLIDASIANISFSGVGLYSSRSIGKGKSVKIRISFIDKHGKPQEDIATGKVDWQSKFKNMYLIGIFFDDELNVAVQPRLIEHLMWLIDTYQWPQPYKDQRIAML